MKSIAKAGLLASALTITSMAHAATQFNFQFDNASFSTPRGQIGAPIVGTGTFTSAADLQPGTYSLSTLGAYTMSFNFNGGPSFSQSDIQTPLSQVAIRISNYSAGILRLQFTEDGVGNGGPNAGALDLNDGANALSFEPTFNGGNDFYFMSAATFSNSGNYLALSPANGGVPEPSTWAMLVLGFGAIGAGLRARSRRVNYATA